MMAQTTTDLRAVLSGDYYAAEARGVFWDRIAWAWRAQDGNGASETFPTWSEATAWLDGGAGWRGNVLITWNPIGYPPEGETVDLTTVFGYGDTKTRKSPRKAKRKGKRK